MSWDLVYGLVRKIPRGRVTTYGELARALALPGGARAIGYAMAACPSGEGIPWHRVVGAGGRITIPEPHAILQRRLLESEGVVIERGKIIGMESHAWNPSHEKAAEKPQRKKKAKRRFATKTRL